MNNIYLTPEEAHAVLKHANDEISFLETCINGLYSGKAPEILDIQTRLKVATSLKEKATRILERG